MIPQRRHSRFGSALLVVLGVITVLSVMVGTVLVLIQANGNTLNQAVSWQQAFVAAEAGVHQAVAQVQTQFIPLLNQTNPPDLSGTQSGTPALSGTLTTSGEGNVSASYGYVLTGTKCAVNASGPSVQTYFRILATGTARVAGKTYLGLDAADVVIRKLSFTSNSAVATRQIEAWVRPVFSTVSAIASGGLISMNNHNISVDSFNSKDPNRSVGLVKNGFGDITTYGQPSPTIGFFNSKSINNAHGGTMASDNFHNANIGTNGQVIEAGNAYIYGDTMTNGGVTSGTQHIAGTIRNDFSQVLAPVAVPSGTFPSTNATTLTGGLQSSPARYQISNVAISGNGSNLTFATAGSSSLSYVELYVPGDFSVQGNGLVIINPGVNVKIYVGGNISVGGNGISNLNGVASSLSIQGITPADGSSRSADFGGTSTFIGTVYAPAYDVALGGTPTYIGSIVGKTVTMNGNVDFHYDEALDDGGLITRYKLVSWFENTKKIP